MNDIISNLNLILDMALDPKISALTEKKTLYLFPGNFRLRIVGGIAMLKYKQYHLAKHFYNERSFYSEHFKYIDDDSIFDTLNLLAFIKAPCCSFASSMLFEMNYLWNWSYEKLDTQTRCWLYVTGQKEEQIERCIHCHTILPFVSLHYSKEPRFRVIADL